ncbi:hypothetical protein KFE25_012383 [Diacronema lutheri]|uniref:Uncharacterized protein n=1 Tax=Diacronema lutheri TaxID=2081491 RepID=A0A8J6CCP4_DIALT|nr:hypothetical protein KFE25_012383 [Diacronema lutheri]
MPAGPLWERPGRNQILPQSGELLDEDAIGSLLSSPTSPSAQGAARWPPPAESSPRPDVHPPARRPPVSSPPPPPQPVAVPPPPPLLVVASPPPQPVAPAAATPPTRPTPQPAAAALLTPSTCGPVGAAAGRSPSAAHAPTPTHTPARELGAGARETSSTAAAEASTPRAPRASPYSAAGASAGAGAAMSVSVGDASLGASPYRTAPNSTRISLSGFDKDEKAPPAGRSRRSKAALGALLALLALTGGAAAVVGTSGRRALGGAPAGSWTLDLSAGAQLDGAGWEQTSSFWGANGGLQWFSPASARVRDGVLALEARPTADSPRGARGEAIGLAAVLGCGRAAAGTPLERDSKQALAPCAPSGLVDVVDLGGACARDPLAGRCNLTIGVAPPKSKGPASMLPPVRSAMVHAASAADAGAAAIVTHGTLELTVRLPRGDWLRPYIHLLPAPLRGARAQRADGADVAAVRLLDGRGNGPDCAFKDGIGNGTFGARIEWGPSASASKLGGRTPTALFAAAGMPSTPAAAAAAAAAAGQSAADEWLVLTLTRSSTRLVLTARSRSARASAARELVRAELIERSTTAEKRSIGAGGGPVRDLCVTTAAATAATCVPLAALGGDGGDGGDGDAAVATGIFNAPLALVAGLAVGSGMPGGASALDETYGAAGAEFGADGECVKPWADGVADAPARLLAAQSAWLPTWTRPRLEIAAARFTAQLRDAHAPGGAPRAADQPYAGGSGGDGGGELGSAAGAVDASADGARARAPTPAVEMSPVELAVTMKVAPPDALSEDEAHVCSICTAHRCSTSVDRTCAVRNGYFKRGHASASAAERWGCLCGCCQSQCGLRVSCASGSASTSASAHDALEKLAARG